MAVIDASTCPEASDSYATQLEERGLADGETVGLPSFRGDGPACSHRERELTSSLVYPTPTGGTLAVK